jgi:hypothetical protein
VAEVLRGLLPLHHLPVQVAQGLLAMVLLQVAVMRAIIYQGEVKVSLVLNTPAVAVAVALQIP